MTDGRIKIATFKFLSRVYGKAILKSIGYVVESKPWTLPITNQKQSVFPASSVQTQRDLTRLFKDWKTAVLSPIELPQQGHTWDVLEVGFTNK